MYTTLHIMSLYIDYLFAFISYDTTYTSYIWDSDARSCLSPPADGLRLPKPDISPSWLMRRYLAWQEVT